MPKFLVLPTDEPLFAYKQNYESCKNSNILSSNNEVVSLPTILVC